MKYMNEDTKKLDEKIRETISLPKYQPGYKGHTWCIIAAYDILTQF